jgi:hypothetical protein
VGCRLGGRVAVWADVAVGRFDVEFVVLKGVALI